MNKYLILQLFTFLFATLAIPTPAISKTYVNPHFKEVLPENWSIHDVALDAVPYNLAIKEGVNAGVAIEFRGSATVKGPRGYNDEKESFTIWIMPPDYEETTPKQMAQFGPAALLGLNSKMKVYFNCFSSTPTWKTCKDDLIKYLELKTKALKPGARVNASEPRR